MPWTLDQSQNRATRYSHSAVAANATNNSDALDVVGHKTIAVQVVHASHSDTSTWIIQSTLDGTNWDTVSGATATTAGAAGSGGVVIHPCAFRQIRLRVTETDANASATLTPFVVVGQQ